MTSKSAEATFNLSPAALADLTRDVVAYARQKGATSCEADISMAVGQTVSVRKGEVETIEYNRDKGLGVTVYLGQQRAHASTADYSRPALEACVDKALAIARHTAPDPAAGLADPDRLAKDYPDLDLCHPWALPVEAAIELARECEAAAFRVDPRITNSEGASVSVHEAQFVYANSLGFCGGYRTSRHSISSAVIAEQGDEMQRDYWYTTARDPAEMQAAAEVGRLTGERAVRRLGSRKIATCQVPVLFEAPVATGLIGHFVGAVSGGNLYRKASFLVDGMGKQVFPDWFDLLERPHIPKALASAPFDDEGVATADRDVIKDGIIRGYFLGSYSARKLGLPTTANAGGNHNLIVPPGPDDFAGLLRRMGTGLVVTETLGQGVNLVTGDYSRGVAGFWVENGEIQHAVEEVTIAGNLADMYRNIVAVGSDIERRGSKQVGSILIEGMTIAGA